MLLAVDVGNTNTVVGVFDGPQLVGHWRLETRDQRTADEYLVLLHAFFDLGGVPLAQLREGIVSCVVPAALQPLDQAVEKLGCKALIVSPGFKTGMPVLTDNPREVGADRIVNAVAAFDHYKGACIVVDFGTATTFDCISARGEYLGGAIAPGLTISADALYHHAAKLPRVEVARPRAVVGKNTVHSMQAGLFFGYVGLIDGIVRRMVAELAEPHRVVATGGLAQIIAPATETIEETDPLLTLRGLRILFDRNHAAS